MANLVNAERISLAFGTRTLLDGVSLGIGTGEVVGVVGRNGDGKTSLLRLLTGDLDPDAGRVIRTGSVSVGFLHQADDVRTAQSLRDRIVAGRPDHVWAADARTRAVVEHLVGDLDLDAAVAELSGGERRRVALAALLVVDHDLLVLDEPTNHLDVEAVAWLADHLRAEQDRGLAQVVVSHDRWFLDAVCTRIWEVHDGVVDGYDGGYAAYVLARAERARLAADAESRRRNLLRKELAWLRRGPPARTSKPKFRIDAANELIAGEPPPRDRLELQRFASTRLGKDVFELSGVGFAVDDRMLLDDLDWTIGPGDRIGLVGVNGSGKTTLLRLLTGDLSPDRGRVRRGKTVRIGYLSQAVAELWGSERVLESVERLRRQVRLAGGGEASVTSLLEDFGFTGDRLTARLDDLSGGERRRLQLLRLLLAEPNVLLLDEPTNDLDIDTLTVIEDYLDRWPGTLVVVTHDRYFLERTCDVTYALLGDGTCPLLPGGVEQYLASRASAVAVAAAAESAARTPEAGAGNAPSPAARTRLARKDLSRIESQLASVEGRISSLHDQMAAAASDYVRLAALESELRTATDRQAELEERWLVAAEDAG